MDDFGTVTEPGTVRLERRLPARVERVWHYLTDSDKRRQWLADGAVELRLGGRVDHVFRNNALTEGDEPAPAKYQSIAEEAHLTGTVTACDPPRLLSYSWGDAAGDASEVTFELTERGEETDLVVTHRRLRDKDAMVSVASGWHSHLGILAARLAGTRPDGFWASIHQLEPIYTARIGEDAGSASP